MDFVSDLFGEVFTEALGWFLIHSLWQGAIVAVLLLLIIALLKNRSAQLRYYISYAALLLIVFSTSFTFYKAFIYAGEKAQLKETIIRNPAYLSDQIKENYFADQTDKSLKEKNDIKLGRIKLKAGIEVYFPWIVSIWAIGLLLYLVRVSGSFIYLFRIRSFRRIPFEADWINKTRKFCSVLKIKKRVNIFLSLKIKTPITIGYFKPLILVPVSLASGLSPEILEAIIAHELAHIRRNDYLLNLLQTLIETLFFYHPGIWYISSQIRHERELSCDDIALGLTSDRVNYAKALTITQENTLIPGNLAPAFASGKSNLLQRIKRLNTKITMKTNLFEKLTAGLLILSAFFFLSFIIDGSNTTIKENNSTIENVPDTLANPKVVIVHKFASDTVDDEKIVRCIHENYEDEIDSLIKVLRVYDDPDDEVEKMIEIVLCEPEIIDYEEIMKNIHIALDEIDMEEIEKELKEVREELTEHAQILKCENLVELEKLKNCDSLNKVIIVSMKDAMEIAREELENLNIDSIVNQAMEEANQSIKDLDIELIIADAMEEAHAAIEEEHQKIIKIKKDLDEKKMDLAEEEINLKQKEAELKQQLKELEEQLKELKQKQKEELKKSE